MKNKIFIVLLLGIVTALAFSFSTEAPRPLANILAPKTLEEVGPAIVNCLKNNDPIAFYSLFLSPVEFEEVIKSSTMPAEKKDLALADKKFYKLREEAEMNWQKLRVQIAQANITWKDVTEERYRTETEFEQKILTGSLNYKFKSDGKPYTISCRHLVKTTNGWKLTKRVRFEDELEYNDLIRRDSLLADSVMKADMAAMEFEMKRMMIRDSLVADSIRKAGNKKKKK
jgi:hypothetical protein